FADRAERSRADRPWRRHRVDDQGRDPVPRPDADARGEGHGREGARLAADDDDRGAVTAPSLDVTATIAAPPGTILRAFFDPEALHAWWQTARSVTSPRMLGPYAIEWAPTDFHDEVLGPLGGVFRGTVVTFEP